MRSAVMAEVTSPLASDLNEVLFGTAASLQVWLCRSAFTGVLTVKKDDLKSVGVLDDRTVGCGSVLMTIGDGAV